MARGLNNCSIILPEILLDSKMVTNFYHSPEAGTIYGYSKLRLPPFLELLSVFMQLFPNSEDGGVLLGNLAAALKPFLFTTRV